MSSGRCRLLLPSIWCLGCLGGLQHPGDEYGLFGLGSIAGTWTVLLTDQLQPLPTLLAGGAILFGLGVLLDLLRAPAAVWVLSWLASATVVYAVTQAGYPSVDAAVRKNGSLLAYMIFASQLGTCLASVATLVGAAVLRYAAMVRRDLAAPRA